MSKNKIAGTILYGVAFWQLTCYIAKIEEDKWKQH